LINFKTAIVALIIQIVFLVAVMTWRIVIMERSEFSCMMSRSACVLIIERESNNREERKDE